MYRVFDERTGSTMYKGSLEGCHNYLNIMYPNAEQESDWEFIWIESIE